MKKKKSSSSSTLLSGVLGYLAGREEPRTALDGVEELDLDGLLPGEEEETWLYVSSRAGMCVDSPPLSPLQWCRQVLDSPRSEDAQRVQSLHLPRASRWCLSPSPPLLCHVKGVSPNSACSPPLAGKSCSTPLFSRRPASPLATPSLPSLRGSLSPLLKELLPPAERSPTFLPHFASRSRRSGVSPERSDEDEGGSIAMGYKLHDLTDVQVMARLQEESLRAHRYFSFINPRRCVFVSCPICFVCRYCMRLWCICVVSIFLCVCVCVCALLLLSLPHNLPGLRQHYASVTPPPERRSSPWLRPPRLRREEDEEISGLLSPPPPLDPSTLPQPHAFSSTRECGSLDTPPDTPPTSPIPTCASGPFSSPAVGLGPGGPSVARVQDLRPGSDKLRRSMPNLVRAPSMPSVPASVTSAYPRAPLCLLRSSLSFDSSVQLQSSIQPQNRLGCLSSSSPGQPLKATAYVSPTTKGSVAMPTGIPLLGCRTPTQPTTPRSCLPRLTTSSSPRSRIAQSARSLSTPRKSLAPLSTLRHAGWNDGCY